MAVSSAVNLRGVGNTPRCELADCKQTQPRTTHNELSRIASIPPTRPRRVQIHHASTLCGYVDCESRELYGRRCLQLLNRRCQNCVLRVRQAKRNKKKASFFGKKKSLLVQAVSLHFCCSPRAPRAQREKTTKTLTHPGTTLNSDGSLRMFCAVVLLHDGV